MNSNLKAARIHSFWEVYHPKWLDRIVWLATQAGNMLTAFLFAWSGFWLSGKG